MCSPDIAPSDASTPYSIDNTDHPQGLKDVLKWPMERERARNKNPRSYELFVQTANAMVVENNIREDWERQLKDAVAQHLDFMDDGVDECFTDMKESPIPDLLLCPVCENVM